MDVDEGVVEVAEKVFGEGALCWASNAFSLSSAAFANAVFLAY